MIEWMVWALGRGTEKGRLGANGGRQMRDKERKKEEEKVRNKGDFWTDESHEL